MCGAELCLDPGEIGVLLGENGVGKSTLIKAVCGIERLNGGSVLLNGENILRLSARERAKRIAYVPQNITFGELSVYETVLTGRLASFFISASKKDKEAAHTIIKQLDLAGLEDRNADSLSGGEKQKVAIARALVGEPKLLVFDEPSANLDLANARLFMNLAKKSAKERGISVLCSLHDLSAAAALGDKFFFMKKGKIKYSGGKELFCSEIIEDIFGVKTDIINHNNKIFISGDIL